VSDILRLVVDLATLLFPLRLVHPWERGLYFFCGRYVATLRPGCYPVLPWFSDVRTVSIVPSVHTTPLQTVGAVTFSASLVLRVTDPVAAYTTLERYEESALELAGAVLSDAVRAGSADLVAITAQINAELSPHGVEITRLRFLNHTHAPAVRVLMERP